VEVFDVRNFFAVLTRNRLSLFGCAVVTASAILILTLFVLGLVGLEGSPYLGILVYLILPAVFVTGLVLIPVGIYRQRRAEKRAGLTGSSALPVVDLNRPRTRHALLIFLVLSAVNVVVLSVATYKGVEVMDSTRFCGATCHTVMEPEYTSYRHSAHAHVACVNCHIGPGASWFVKSKLSGAWQVIAVAFDLYPRPIPTPVANLRPARETCEQCHWPDKFVGDRLRVTTEYSPDQDNTALRTVLLMHIGGVQAGNGRGIHWHVAPDVHIRYQSNPDRTVIPVVEVSRPGAAKQVFTAASNELGDRPWRLMDCLDCHNRPTHVFFPPGRAIDAAMEQGRIPVDLPFVKREGLHLIQALYQSDAEARNKIPAALLSFYQGSFPALVSSRKPDIERAGAGLADAYSRNVFPAMNVGWNTYRNFLGHPDDSGGCFRCHDGAHLSSAGNAITQDCTACHALLADHEKSPAILEQLQQ
jgi:hypothetical protein